MTERLSGYDQGLVDLARTLASESADEYPNGPLFWNELASDFVGGLVARHTWGAKSRERGTLGKDVLGRLRDYVVAHLDEPIEVATLANIAGRSPFHFSRVFTRSVGMTPHRYIVHLRLRRAIDLVRDGRSGLAEIAARTGFADQKSLVALGPARPRRAPHAAGCLTTTKTAGIFTTYPSLLPKSRWTVR